MSILVAPLKRCVGDWLVPLLLKDLDLIERIVSELVNALDVPVTIKTRTGLTRSDDLGRVAIVRAESVGARMAVLHGRSKECKFQGTADYRKIRSVVDCSYPNLCKWRY